MSIQLAIALNVPAENLLNILLIRLYTIKSRGYREYIKRGCARYKILLHVIIFLRSERKLMGIEVISGFYAHVENVTLAPLLEVSEGCVLFHLKHKAHQKLSSPRTLHLCLTPHGHSVLQTCVNNYAQKGPLVLFLFLFFSNSHIHLPVDYVTYPLTLRITTI